MKQILNIAIASSFTIVLTTLKNESRILIILALIFWPMPIQVFGRDAFTVSTILIYIFASLYIVKSLLRATILKEFNNLIVILLVLSGIVSTLQVPYGELTGVSVRKFSDFLSSIALFSFITNLEFENEKEKINFIDKAFSFIIISICIQIFIGLIIYYNFSIAKIFTYFTFRDVKEIEVTITEGYVVQGGIKRLRSLIFLPEFFGEILAMLCPVVMHKYVNKKSIIWLIVYFLFFIGLLLSGTRSGLLLFLVATAISLIININRISFLTVYLFTFLGVVAIFIALIYNPGLYEGIITRFNISLETYQKTGSFIASINRAGLENVQNIVYTNLNLFGHGLMPAYHYKIFEYHFHNLYLTLLWQFGLVGTIFYIALFLNIFFNNIFSFNKSKDIKKYEQINSIRKGVILSIGIFFINEMKFEFNRVEAYQQLCWSLFGLYCLTSKDKYYKKG